MDSRSFEEKLKALVEEAIRRLMKGRLLVMMTGGTIGAETALKELEKA